MYGSRGSLMLCDVGSLFLIVARQHLLPSLYRESKEFGPQAARYLKQCSLIKGCLAFPSILHACCVGFLDVDIDLCDRNSCAMHLACFQLAVGDATNSTGSTGNSATLP